MSEKIDRKEVSGSTQEHAFSAEAHKRAFQNLFASAFPEKNGHDAFFNDSAERKFIFDMCLELVVSKSSETPSTFRARLEDMITHMIPFLLRDKDLSKKRSAGERTRYFADQLCGAYAELYGQNDPAQVIDLDARRAK